MKEKRKKKKSDVWVQKTVFFRIMKRESHLSTVLAYRPLGTTFFFFCLFFFSFRVESMKAVQSYFLLQRTELDVDSNDQIVPEEERVCHTHAYVDEVGMGSLRALYLVYCIHPTNWSSVIQPWSRKEYNAETHNHIQDNRHPKKKDKERLGMDKRT